jgi:dipeptidyl aminopeptidase/acylaminoacyl peptidase
VADNETFAELSSFLAIPRVAALALAPDGSRLVACVSQLNRQGNAFRSALWSIDPDGKLPARRLTRSQAGEASPVFAPDGSVLFRSSRPDPEAAAAEAKDTGLWRLPVAGEAELILKRAGGVSSFAVARGSGRLVIGTNVMPGAVTSEEDKKARKARADAKVCAILHEEPLVRFWDHDLGPGREHVLTAALGEDGSYGEPVDLTPASRGLTGGSVAVSDDGTLVAYEAADPDDVARLTGEVVVVDAVTGDRRFAVHRDGYQFASPVFTPDGRHLLCTRSWFGDESDPNDATMWIVDIATGEGRELAAGFEQWPKSPVVAPDGTAAYFVADEGGHAPVFRVELADGAVTRLTAGGAYSHVCPSPDGTVLYALCNAVDCPPGPVRLDARAVDQTPVRLRAPGEVTQLPGTLTELRTTAADGTELRSWLVLPTAASAKTPAPLLLLVHGGPMRSWNGWSWRWNPWLAAARGWAVLLPDPALSTGYGQYQHTRGWRDWTGAPYDDVMALTDAACARPDIDAEHTAMMGGSFGGYMANLIAVTTDRFKAIVTHASLWNLSAFVSTSDHPPLLRRVHGDPVEAAEHYREQSPHQRANKITTPMLVIHGNRDYQVPISESMSLWSDLVRHGVAAKFLYFPDENHWVLKPGHIKVWYETCFAFLDHHVLGAEWKRPELL